MPLTGVATGVDRVDVLTDKDKAAHMKEDAEEAVLTADSMEELAVHTKMGLTFHILPVTLKMNSEPRSQTKQEEGYWRTLFAPNSWQKIIDRPSFT